MTDPSSRLRVVFVAANPSIDRLYELDRLTVGAIHRPKLVVAVPGGKGLNAARAAAKLGARVTAIGIVGGRAGDWIVERLAQTGIEARMARSTGETRTCISVLDRSSGDLTEIYEHGEPIGADAWDDLEAIFVRELDRGDVGAVALSGSQPAGAPADGFARLARAAAARSDSIRVLADTYGSALAAVLAERSAVVKLNAAEAGEATGQNVIDAASAVDAGRILRERGAVSAIVTLGVAGAIAVTPTDAIRLVPPNDRGAYSVGSGDAFLGGLAAALVDGAPLVEAARLGLAAGIANARIPGAGELDPNSVPRILDKVAVTTV